MAPLPGPLPPAAPRLFAACGVDGGAAVSMGEGGAAAIQTATHEGQQQHRLWLFLSLSHSKGGGWGTLLHHSSPRLCRQPKLRLQQLLRRLHCCPQRPQEVGFRHLAGQGQGGRRDQHEEGQNNLPVVHDACQACKQGSACQSPALPALVHLLATRLPSAPTPACMLASPRPDQTRPALAPTWSPSASIIVRRPACVTATSTLSAALSCCSTLGPTTSSPPGSSAARAAATGPPHGMSLHSKAAEAAETAMASGSHPPSALSTCANA